MVLVRPSVLKAHAICLIERNIDTEKTRMKFLTFDGAPYVLVTRRLLRTSWTGTDIPENFLFLLLMLSSNLLAWDQDRI